MSSPFLSVTIFTAMKQLFISCCVCLLVSSSHAQISAPDTVANRKMPVTIPDTMATKKNQAPISDSPANVKTPISIPDSVINRRNSLNQTNSTVLLAWAGANIVQGSISAGNLHGSDHYFHQMNAYWNTVNLALAGYGLYRVHQQKKKKYTLAESLKEQQREESLLLLNTGLDAAFISTGLFLKEKGVNTNNDQTQGYGGSLVLQGSFLLVFDLIQYFEHQQNGKLLNQYLGNWQLTPTATGVGLVLPL